MQKIICIIILLLSLTSFAQNRFIEVEVRDTITLQPQKLYYNILIGDSYQDEEWDDNQAFDQKSYEKRIKKNKDKVEKKLQSKKFNIKPYAGNITYPPLGAPNIDGFTITVNDKQELKALQELLTDFDFISCSINPAEYKDEENAEGRLLKKLISKAKSKAALIASYSDLKLGKIIEVKEGKELEDLSFNIRDIYFETENKGFSEDNLTGSLSKSITIKFAAE